MKRKKLLFVGVGIVAILVILFLIFGRSAKPSDLAKEFQEKVQSNDAKGLVELVKPENNQVSWNEKDAESIIKYLKDDNNDFDDQMQLLNAQASYYESDGKATNMISQEYPGESISNIGPFYITREKGLLGDKYLIKARGYKVEVKAAKGATVIFNGEKVDMNNKSSKVLGYYGPGVYKVKGQKKFEYTSVSDERNLTLFDPDDFEETANLDFSGDTVNIASSVPNTELMVNGKKTGKQVEEDSSFGPVKEGMILQGVAHFPWGEGKSQEVKVKTGTSNSSQSYDLTPNPVTNNEVRENIKSTINDFAKNRIAAKASKDVNKLKNASENLKKDYAEAIDNYDSKNYFEGKALGTRIDFSAVTYENASGGKQLLHIPVEFHDKTREVMEYVDSETEDDFSEEKITLEYDENKKAWTVKSEESDYAYGDNEYMTSKEVEKTTF
ncbi:TcaA 3rd/4th domain-containing protein [Bacillus subtilis]|nr:hypothetical protein [Bacillus subtilis]MED3603359.1 hypothetical protein [Bacillus subtilis]MED3694374.1 hypothetical protein [Bacillus subtilis]OTQ84191.1 hypothetical protein BG30_15315 [Bacillus subtilis subsp. subtilis]WGD88105.1 hypothetical protein P5656_21095 [Bacillus subtilis]